MFQSHVLRSLAFWFLKSPQESVWLFVLTKENSAFEISKCLASALGIQVHGPCQFSSLKIGWREPTVLKKSVFEPLRLVVVGPGVRQGNACDDRAQWRHARRARRRRRLRSPLRLVSFAMGTHCAVLKLYRFGVVSFGIPYCHTDILLQNISRLRFVRTAGPRWSPSDSLAVFLAGSDGGRCCWRRCWRWSRRALRRRSRPTTPCSPPRRRSPPASPPPSTPSPSC